jgi:spermidine/putrescine transport system substrate-binding protein
VPADLVAAFKQETGIDVEVTLSNNEEMISKLRATGGAGFDLAQPSQDRITSAQREFGIYKPIDLSKIKLEQFQPALLDIVRGTPPWTASLRLPYLWGTDGIVVNTKRAKVADYTDVCRPDLKGKTAIRLRRPSSWPLPSPRARIRSRFTATRRPTRRSWIRWAPRSSPASRTSSSSTTTRISC